MTEKKMDREGRTELVGLEEKREEFLETFFRKGAEFANELIGEVQQMRDQVQKLNEDNLLLKHQLASDDAIRELLVKIDHLESEKVNLSHRMQQELKVHRDYASRYAEMESELDGLANLYVASFQLHATLDPPEVLGVIEQLLAQLVGAASFVIYVRSERDGQKELEPVHAYRCELASGTSIGWGEGAIGEVAATQVHQVIDPDARTSGQPLACIPMVLGSETIGVIAIFELFEQKKEFVEIDFELFKLLALHAASGIVGAGLLVRAGNVGSGLDVYKRL